MPVLSEGMLEEEECSKGEDVLNARAVGSMNLFGRSLSQSSKKTARVPFDNNDKMASGFVSERVVDSSNG